MEIYDVRKARFVLYTTGPRYMGKLLKKLMPKYTPLKNLVYTKWKNGNWKNLNRKDFYFENYVSGGWLDTMSNNKPSKTFYLKKTEL
jgi:hypothetical protein